MLLNHYLFLALVLVDPVLSRTSQLPLRSLRDVDFGASSSPVLHRRDMTEADFPIPSGLLVRGGTSVGAGPSRTVCWMALISAILLDTLSTTMMKVATEQKSVSKLCLAYGGYFLSLSGFGFSLSSLDVSVAYAVWAALGTALVSAAGIMVFGEKFSCTKLCCLAMVIVGVIGLNLTEEH